jgi:hypothetical protein
MLKRDVFAVKILLLFLLGCIRLRLLYIPGQFSGCTKEAKINAVLGLMKLHGAYLGPLLVPFGQNNFRECQQIVDYVRTRDSLRAHLS